MFCPKCGQEQASESVRFCSGCGSNLKAVEETLSKLLLKIAMYLLLTTCAIFGWGSFTFSPGYMQVRGIITVLAAITFCLLFQRDLWRIVNKLSSKSPGQTKQTISAAQQSALPPAQSQPTPTLEPRRANTAEMVQPPSITEHTTILLKKKKR